MKALSYSLGFALVLGGISFTAGFVGPMLWDPTSGNGPLLGIFITGPLGFIGGLILGLAVYFLRKPKNRP